MHAVPRLPGLVLQSHRWPLPALWLSRCLDSVEQWAGARGFAYRFVDDALFDVLEPDLLAKCAERRVVATDLARLRWIEQALNEGHALVVWCDADVLVFDPERLDVLDESFSVGREVWVDDHRGRPRVRRHVHNAWLQFGRDNPFLSFYRWTAERMVRAHDGPMVPQFVGPKLLTTLHHLARFPVQEAVNMLAPAVTRDVVAGGGPYREAWRAHCRVPPAAVNLCGSCVDSGEVTEDLIERAIDRILTDRTP